MSSVKKAVRERDGQRCTECGMTAEEHKRQFGRTLHVHRKMYWRIYSTGPYQPEVCETLCERCHYARHHLKCEVRRRDGYVCTECGMTDEEHQKVYGQGTHLEVHCPRSQNCSEREWADAGIKAEECYTLCLLCHLDKHSIIPAVLRRDAFRCRECKKGPEDNRLWYRVLVVHRLEGPCGGEMGRDADPDGFVTLCQECHGKKHPEPDFEECIRLGAVVELPPLVVKYGPPKFGIRGPITRREQLAKYKEYFLLVNFFIEHFRKNGVPKESDIRASLINLPTTTLSAFLRKEAAKEATKAFREPYPTRRQRKEMRRMSKEEQEHYLKDLENRLIAKILKSNEEPRVVVRMNDTRFSVRV